MRQTEQTFLSGQSGQAHRLRFDQPLGTTDYSPSEITRVTLERDDIVKGSVSPQGLKLPLKYSAKGITPFSAGMLSSFRSRVDSRGYQYAHLCSDSGYIFPVHTHVPVPPGVRNACVIKMLTRLSDVKMSGLTALIESREALQMVAKSATVLFKAMNAAALHNPRARARGLARALRTPRVVRDVGTTSASAWLAYHFGWAPIVDDIAKSLAIMHGGFLGDRFLLRAAAGSTSVTPIGAPQNLRLQIRNVYVTNGYWRYDFATRSEFTTDYKIACYWVLSTDVLRNLNQIGVLNLPATVWETTPASFLVDWLVQVKEFLLAFSATVGLDFVAGSETTFTKTEILAGKPSYSTNFSNPLEDIHEYFISPGSAFTMTRTVLDSAPVPYRPTVSDPFSSWRAITAIALLEPYGSKGPLNFRH